ncbi:TonB-dependent receptor [Polynucleobacter sp. HIN5]|uniref:TonB-dependent receptor n=1 Tax=Polynucleobacter sp. HIN5 TaxID=3047864 RepID=UPI002572F61E|nr:TonB-dependent receptor [Polynucleobacter sp. HIN5]BEI33839.1 TonB-dependent receptor [Polynucleobacter sp. HIN5]
MKQIDLIKSYLLVKLLAAVSWSVAHENPALQIDVSGSAESATGILTPTKILQGNELQDKLGTTLGATIGNELGVSQTGYGLGASRPVMRGLEGARVQILQNGLSVGDVSSISADHAVASPVVNARQIEILRGAAALLYGSGSSGGLVNIVNDRILTTLPGEATGSANTSYDSVSNGRAASGHVDTSFESIAIHVDTAINNNQNYRIPGNSTQGGPNQVWGVPPGGPFENYTGKLPNSFNNQNNLGVGASYIGKSGYTGISVERMNNNYGIPTPEGGMIAQSQNRYDFQHQTRDPFAGFSSIKFSAANSNYNHTEFSILNGAYSPAALWKNIANEARLELAHKAVMGWKGTFGAQVTSSSVEATDIATGSYAILPSTKTNSNALFWIEEGRWGVLQGNLGLRYDLVGQNPNQSTEFEPLTVNSGVAPSAPGLQNRNFNLISYSAGGLWNFTNGYGTGLSYTVSQRAPSAQELYSYGVHESTATFAVGNSNLSKETSHNLEVNIQKTIGKVRGKVNVYLNKFSNYIYGYYTGQTATNAEDFSVVQAQQAAATIKGAEGELTYNWGNVGSGARLFADASQGTFDAGGNLPLQPAPRIGVQVAHQKNGWLANASYTYSFQQNRLATWEVGPTPSYNLLNAGLSYTEKINKVSWTGYMMLKNILNDDIRYATTPMAVRLYAPQPGRSLMVGVRANF